MIQSLKHYSRLFIENGLVYWYNPKSSKLESNHNNNRHLGSMSFVQSHLLMNLSCASCKKYLSHFPIYSHPEQGSVCGRCPKPTYEGFIQNVLYETLAETLRFPCCNDANGCTENLRPGDVPLHEKFCSFLKYTCPMANCTNCTWQGLVQDLLEHTDQKHPTFLLKEGRFEMDFINNYNENYLLPFGEELFIVNRKTDSLTNVFSCTVSYIGSNTKAENYSYEITLENGGKTHSHKISNKMTSTTSIKGDEIRSILNDPMSIIAHIDIVQSIENPSTGEILVDFSSNKEEECNESLNVNVLRELECSVCLEYMLTPIHQCKTGHSICEGCRIQLTECPTCKQGFGDTRNIALANIISEMIFPCKHQKCKFTSKGKYIKEHQATCIYGPFACPLKEYEDCNVEISYLEIYHHVLNNHYENLLEMNVVSVPFDEESISEYYDCYILRHDFKLFKLHYLYRDYTFQWALQMIGPPEESSNYKFDIDIIDNGNNDNRFYLKGTCSALSHKDSAFNEDKPWLYVNLDQISSMVTTELTYRVRVLQGKNIFNTCNVQRA